MSSVTNDYCSCSDCRAPAEVERLTTALREEQEVHAECCRQADTAQAEVERLTKERDEAKRQAKRPTPETGPCRCEGQPEPGPWHEHACPYFRESAPP